MAIANSSNISFGTQKCPYGYIGLWKSNRRYKRGSENLARHVEQVKKIEKQGLE